jgi:hypothetical protein
MKEIILIIACFLIFANIGKDRHISHMSNHSVVLVQPVTHIQKHVVMSYTPVIVVLPIIRQHVVYIRPIRHFHRGYEDIHRHYR